MDHREIQDKMFLLDDPALPEAERRTLLSHAEVCEACAGLISQWRRVQGTLAGAGRPPASEAFVESVMARIPVESEPTAVPAGRRNPWFIPQWSIPRLGFGLAALALVVLLARPQPAIGIETLLLAGSPAGADWEFSLQSPDVELLLGATPESP